MTRNLLIESHESSIHKWNGTSVELISIYHVLLYYFMHVFVIDNIEFDWHKDNILCFLPFRPIFRGSIYSDSEDSATEFLENFEEEMFHHYVITCIVLTVQIIKHVNHRQRVKQVIKYKKEPISFQITSYIMQSILYLW